MSILRKKYSIIGLILVISLLLDFSIQHNLSASNTYQYQLEQNQLNEEQLQLQQLSNKNNKNNDNNDNDNIEIRGFITSVITSSDTSNNVSNDNQLIETIRKTLVEDDGGGMIIDDLTNPCLVHFCSKGHECAIEPETGLAKCICTRKCHIFSKHRRREICGSNGILYKSYCELLRDSCLINQTIRIQKITKCEKNINKSNLFIKTSTAGAIEINGEQLYSLKVEVASVPTILSDVPPLTAISKQSTTNCTLQQYELMKDNLLLYSHKNLLLFNRDASNRQHNKNFLVSVMFSHYDQNNNGHLELDELERISQEENIRNLTNGSCDLVEMLRFDDKNNDHCLSLNEFNQAFSKLYSVSVVSLDKALETNHLSVRIGDNVEIKCDVTGQPLPPIIWQRYNYDISQMNDVNNDIDEVRVFNDGSLYITNIQLKHSGNYTCHAQRNKDIVQTHIITVFTTPEVYVTPHLQSRRPTEVAEIDCNVIGEPLPTIKWMKNDETIEVDDQSRKYEFIGNGTTIRIKDIKYSDTGAYMCAATSIGGSVRDLSSLIIQDVQSPAIMSNDRKFFVFHSKGISIYESTDCRLVHEIQGIDLISGTEEYVCDQRTRECKWGHAINIGDNDLDGETSNNGIGLHLIYISQPYMNRVLVISVPQLTVTEVIETDKFPLDLHYVPTFDQVWILNWQWSLEPKVIEKKTFNQNATDDPKKIIQIVKNVRQTQQKHIAIHPQTVDNKFDLVKNLFIPSADIKNSMFVKYYNYKYGYVTHHNQRGIYKLDMANLRYIKYIDLTLYNCVPQHIEFSELYGFVIISCLEPITNKPQGQLVLDYLTDSLVSIKPTLIGQPKISPNSCHLITINHKVDSVLLIVQKITPNGLKFAFDVETTLNISDIVFIKSQTTSEHNIYATTDKEDVLYLDLVTGKVETITSVGVPDTFRWYKKVRPIKASGLFGDLVVTPSKNAVYVISSRTRTVKCEIGELTAPINVMWDK